MIVHLLFLEQNRCTVGFTKKMRLFLETPFEGSVYDEWQHDVQLFHLQELVIRLSIKDIGSVPHNKKTKIRKK